MALFWYKTLVTNLPSDKNYCYLYQHQILDLTLCFSDCRSYTLIDAVISIELEVVPNLHS